MKGSRHTVGTTDGNKVPKTLRMPRSRAEWMWGVGRKMTEVWTRDPAGLGVIDGNSEAGIQAWCCH